jgi:sortase A
MKTKSRKFLELVLLAGGVAGLGLWGWSAAREGVYEDWHNWLFDRQESGRSATVADYFKDRLTGSNKPAETVDPAVPVAPLPRRPANGNLLGRLQIPRLKLQAVVREGTAEKTLSIALGHVAGTAKPGENGNVGVAGHRDSLFRGLRNIQLNDRIVFETSEGDTYIYQVTGTKIVKPTEVSVLNAGLYPELTLVTCYPFNYIGSAPERFIVKARQMGQTTRGLAGTEVAGIPERAPVPAQTPAPRSEEARKPVREAAGQRGGKRVPFEVAMNHSRQLTPGISIGLTGADATRKTVDGWMWVMPERRTIWLHGQSARQPIVIYGADGERREVVIDSVTRNSMRGYLVL